jgi:hypothetical protein
MSKESAEHDDRYLTLSAIYQYGEQPPFFSFVDHKLTLGLKLQAMQMKGKGRHNDESLTKLVVFDSVTALYVVMVFRFEFSLCWLSLDSEADSV